MGTATLNRDEILLLFDVDGTLTMPRSVVTPEFEEFFYSKVKPRATIGIVGGSDLEKMFEQLNGDKILNEFDFIFPENGLVQIEGGKEVGKQNIIKHLGEKTLKRFINFVLRYLSELDVPIKRGTFIEFRNGMMNVCPIGRQCTREERNMFAEYDIQHKVREKMIKDLKEEFADVDLMWAFSRSMWWMHSSALWAMKQVRFRNTSSNNARSRSMATVRFWHLYCSAWLLVHQMILLVLCSL